MKKLLFIATMLFTILTLPSCEGVDGPDPPPVFSEIAIRLEYIGLDDFIVRHADKIDGDIFTVDCKPGKYVVSAEYVNPNTDDDNIILESVNVEVQAEQPLEVILKINLNKIEKQKQN